MTLWVTSIDRMSSGLLIRKVGVRIPGDPPNNVAVAESVYANA
jgi:hypothetical protein